MFFVHHLCCAAFKMTMFHRSVELVTVWYVYWLEMFYVVEVCLLSREHEMEHEMMSRG